MFQQRAKDHRVWNLPTQNCGLQAHWGGFILANVVGMSTAWIMRDKLPQGRIGWRFLHSSQNSLWEVICNSLRFRRMFRSAAVRIDWMPRSCLPFTASIEANLRAYVNPQPHSAVMCRNTSNRIRCTKLPSWSLLRSRVWQWQHLAQATNRNGFT